MTKVAGGSGGVLSGSIKTLVNTNTSLNITIGNGGGRYSSNLWKRCIWSKYYNYWKHLNMMARRWWFYRWWWCYSWSYWRFWWWNWWIWYYQSIWNSNKQVRNNGGNAVDGVSGGGGGVSGQSDMQTNQTMVVTVLAQVHILHGRYNKHRS